MLQKTRGIVLHHIPYSDSAIIAYIFTEEFGRQSYMVSGVRSKKSSVRINLFQPLSLLDMVVYYKQGRDLQRIKELKVETPFSSLPYQPVKNSIALFIAEILYKSVQEETANRPMFEYLQNAILHLDAETGNVVNFHLYFMVHLTRFLGFPPVNNYSAHNTWFDMIEGKFVAGRPAHSHIVHPAHSPLLRQLLDGSFNDPVAITNTERSLLIEKIIEYYRIHLLSLKEIKSYTILRAVFS